MRRLALAAVLAVASSALTAMAQADSRGHRFTTTDAMVEVVDGPKDDHRVRIDTRLYVPASATARAPQPAVLMTHGFGLNKLSPEVTSMASYLARNGYVVLTYSSQGFGKSGGCITLQSQDYDVKDARQLITKVLETKPFVKKDRKGAVVGMVGGSYGGGIQLNLAAADPRIRVVAPGRTWSSLQYTLDPNNWVVPGDPTGFTQTLAPQGVFKRNWTTLLFGYGSSQPAGGAPPTGDQKGGCPQEKLATDVPGVACTGFRTEACAAMARLQATGDLAPEDKALIARSSPLSPLSRLRRLRVPTLLVQGQHDTLFTINDAVASYTALRRQRVPVKMIWNYGGHGGYNSQPGECEVYGGGTTGLDDCYLTKRTLAFLDQWLRGKPDRSPGFTWYQDWVPYKGKGASNQYAAAPAFPAGSTRTFTLSGTGDLVTSRARTGTVTVVNPPGGAPSAFSEVTNFTGPSANPSFGQLPPREVPGQHASFTSPALAAPLVSVGVPSARLRLRHTAPTDLVMFGKVYDVAPDGSAELVHRLVAPFRVPSSRLTPYVDVKLLGFAHRFEKGHRVRVTFATTDAAAFNNPVPDVLTLATGPGSTFTLPVLRP